MIYIKLIKTFFFYLGMQNDYLFPFEGQEFNNSCQFKKPHWYKTRIGFRTAWGLAKVIVLR